MGFCDSKSRKTASGGVKLSNTFYYYKTMKHIELNGQIR